MNNKINIVFMGTPNYATNILKNLLTQNNFSISAIFTQPDKAVGRKKIITPPHIKQYCINENIKIPIYQPHKLRDEENIKILKEINPDFIIVAAYGQILSQEILDISPCINLHASILPLHRGASPIQQMILNDEQYVGVTSMLMDKGLDTGDILGYKIIKMQKNIFINELFEQLSTLAKEIIINTINNFENIKPIRQINALSSHTKKITKQQGIIDFENAIDIFAKYRAFHSWPNIFLKNGLKLTNIKINNTNIINKKEGLIKKIGNTSIIVSCKIGDLEIFNIQAASKKEILAVEYIKGKRLEVGDLLS